MRTYSGELTVFLKLHRDSEVEWDDELELAKVEGNTTNGDAATGRLSDVEAFEEQVSAYGLETLLDLDSSAYDPGLIVIHGRLWWETTSGPDGTDYDCGFERS